MSGLANGDVEECEAGAALSFLLWFAAEAPDTATVETAVGRGFRRVDGAIHGTMPHAKVIIELAAIGEGAPAHLMAIERAAFDHAQALSLVALVQSEECEMVDLVKELSRFALDLASIEGCIAVGWVPAGSGMDAAYFRTVVGQWLDGGAFPALGLTVLEQTSDGDLQSRGLAILTGQEICVTTSDGLDDVDRAKVAIRMIDHIVRNGAITGAEMLEVDGFGQFWAQPDENKQKINIRKKPNP